MPNIQVRNVPPEVHARLVERAQLAGQSLQEYLLTELSHLAGRPTNKELMDRARRRLAKDPLARGTQADMDDIVRQIRAHRDAL